MGQFPYNRPYMPLAARTGVGVSVRILLGVAVIAVGIANLCFQHRWHRVLGVVAIVTGVVLCALVWFR
jgi:hypothetical protein